LPSDNIGVLRVEFYINDALFATDTSAPYVVYWNTRRIAPGAYVIKAIAYDASGHSATAAVTVTRDDVEGLRPPPRKVKRRPQRGSVPICRDAQADANVGNASGSAARGHHALLVLLDRPIVNDPSDDFVELDGGLVADGTRDLPDVWHAARHVLEAVVEDLIVWDAFDRGITAGHRLHLSTRDRRC
jgi:hypothetical protein